MTRQRYLPLALLLAACTPGAQRDAALAAVAAGAVGTAACGIANGRSSHKFELGACILLGGAVSIGGGVVLHSQLEADHSAEQAGKKE
jgi:hypothetical protein